MNSMRFWLAGVTLFLGISSICAAETATSTEVIPNHPLLQEKYIVSLGAYYPRATTGAALAPASGGTGVFVNFEDTLDLDRRNLTPTAAFFWRATDKWRVAVDYFAINRDATRTLATDVEWGDKIYTAGTMVDSTFNFSDLRISAAYAFFKRRDKELGIGLGLHVSDMQVSINAAGIGAEGGDVTAPLPVVNFYGMFALTDEWAISTRLDWLSLAYGDYSGDVRNMAIDVLYQPFRNIGFGLGARNLVIDVDVDNPDWHGAARIVFQGPTAFVTMSF